MSDLINSEIREKNVSKREYCDHNTTIKKWTEIALRDYHAFLREKMYQTDYAELIKSGYEEGYTIKFELLGRIDEQNRIANNMRKVGLSEEMIARAIATD